MSSKAVSLLIDQAVPRAVTLAVMQSDHPLRSSDVRKAFPGVVKPDLGRIVAALELLVAEKVLFHWPQANRNAYWRYDPSEYLRKLIVQALAERNRPAPDLMAALKPYLFNLSRAFVAQELHALEAEGVLFLHPKLGRMLACYSLATPDPGPYLHGLVEFELRGLLAAGVPLEKLLHTLRTILSSASGMR